MSEEEAPEAMKQIAEKYNIDIEYLKKRFPYLLNKEKLLHALDVGSPQNVKVAVFYLRAIKQHMLYFLKKEGVIRYIKRKTKTKNE